MQIENHVVNFIVKSFFSMMNLLLLRLCLVLVKFEIGFWPKQVFCQKNNFYTMSQKETEPLLLFE